MRLFHSPASPFVRKVMVVLHETGLLSETELVGASGNPVEPGSMPVAHNPLGKIPALVLDDGRCLFDSRVICRYLDARARAGLYGEGDMLWDTLATEALADGMMEAAVLIVYESRIRPEDLRYAPWVEGQWSKIARGLAALEDRADDLAQAPFGMAQIAVASALGYLTFRLPHRDWPATAPRLAAWFETAAQRPSLAATAPHA
ncbi:glutathione S-transferase [Neotabrizicola shimadae]|uniref:Glutathione S-transferase n=1 Tax=Neotabrizicola shimadae TaxID=2807096 RepID=A0A8G0ZZ78_9RHOB|nr:glutathione S-transferase [Neotabrizicola shimadae]QYZ71977.1 glutathione S-transferase [Neotabrizicola shimadae]